MTFLTYSAISICILLSLLLISNNSRSKSNRLMIAWLIVTSFEILIFKWSYVTNAGLTYPVFISLSPVFPLLHAPLIFLYIRSLTGKEINFLEVLHFVPAFLVLLTLVPFWSLEYTKQVAILSQVGADPNALGVLIPRILIIFYVFSYLIAGFRLTAKEGKRTFTPEFRWLNKALLVYIVLLIGIICLSIVAFYSNLDWGKPLAVVSLCFLVLFVWYFGIVGIKATSVFHGLRLATTTKRYERSGLNKKDAERWSNRLSEYLTKERPYLDDKLSLKDLAQAIEISENHLSQVINEQLNSNFFDLINQYRIEEFKRHVVKEENNYLTIFAIAQQCGFKSKSTFTTAFKRMTGQTPSQFKQLNRFVPTGSNQTISV